jgi:tripartite ATP-independent transporter DctM subunit
METYFAIAAILLLAVMGAPIFVVLLSLAMFGFYISDVPLMIVAVELYRISDTPLLLALPLFTLAGYLLAESQSSTRLVNVTQALIGWVPGGLSIIAFVTCALFTAFTGASGVTIVAVGALLYPALKQVGYSERYSLGLVTTSGSLGLLLAPSLPLILYGIIAQQMGVGPSFTIQQLFVAGLIPAALMLIMLSVWSWWIHRGKNIAMQKFTTQELKSALWAARWEIPLPALVIGGIYGGFFAVSETAAVILLYVFIVEVFIYKEISLSQLPVVIRQAVAMVGGIILILGVSLALTNVLIDAEIPTKAFELVQSYIESKWAFLIFLTVFLLILGAILDIFSAIVIMVPILLPIAVAYGIHPVHLGIIFLANMQIGYFTPPVGMNLFIASYRFGKPITELYRAALPFMAVLIVALLLITYIPWLSLGLI